MGPGRGVLCLIQGDESHRLCMCNRDELKYKTGECCVKEDNIAINEVGYLRVGEEHSLLLYAVT